MTLQQEAAQWAWWAAAAGYLVYASLFYLAYAVLKSIIINHRLKYINTAQAISMAIYITRKDINSLPVNSLQYKRKQRLLRKLERKKEFLDF